MLQYSCYVIHMYGIYSIILNTFSPVHPRTHALFREQHDKMSVMGGTVVGVLREVLLKSINKSEQAVKLLISLMEIPGSNSSPDADYLEVSACFLSFSREVRHNALKEAIRCGKFRAEEDGDVMHNAISH